MGRAMQQLGARTPPERCRCAGKTAPAFPPPTGASRGGGYVPGAGYQEQQRERVAYSSSAGGARVAIWGRGEHRVRLARERIAQTRPARTQVQLRGT
eukprot:3848344-Prymnesium_polylepis.1